MSSREPGPWSRAEEEGRLLAAVEAAADGGPRLVHLHGPEGTGKTTLLTRVRRGAPGRALHIDLPPLEEASLLAVLEREGEAVLGPFPRPERRDLLPLPGLGPRWSRLLEGLLVALGSDDAPGLLILDGFDELARARRRLPAELAEILERLTRQQAPVCLILATRTLRLPDPLLPESLDSGEGAGFTSASGGDGRGREVVRVSLGPLSFRAAGWGQGAVDPLDAFRRWAIFGDHPAHLPARRTVRSDDLAEVVIRRVLEPRGDLHDAPLARLRGVVQAPARYAGILAAVAAADRDWSEMTETLGGGRGSRLAPYIQRLESEGLLSIRLPLEAPEGSRRRRYGSVDPFLSFWFGLVLPVRSRLLRESPTRVWREAIEPRLGPHFDRWLAEAARRWLQGHAAEALPAEARSVGALWGEETEMEVAGRLANGQVCYGVVQRGGGEAGPELMSDARALMAKTRFGIGRQARAPLIFIRGELSTELRRVVGRDPLAEVIGPARLMGEGPPW